MIKILSFFGLFSLAAVALVEGMPRLLEGVFYAIVLTVLVVLAYKEAEK